MVPPLMYLASYVVAASVVNYRFLLFTDFPLDIYRYLNESDGDIGGMGTVRPT